MRDVSVQSEAASVQYGSRTQCGIGVLFICACDRIILTYIRKGFPGAGHDLSDPGDPADRSGSGNVPDRVLCNGRRYEAEHLLSDPDIGNRRDDRAGDLFGRNVVFRMEAVF